MLKNLCHFFKNSYVREQHFSIIPSDWKAILKTIGWMMANTHSLQSKRKHRFQETFLKPLRQQDIHFYRVNRLHDHNPKKRHV